MRPYRKPSTIERTFNPVSPNQKRKEKKEKKPPPQLAAAFAKLNLNPYRARVGCLLDLSERMLELEMGSPGFSSHPPASLPPWRHLKVMANQYQSYFRSKVS